MKHILNFNELHEDFSQYLTEEDLEITDDGINELLSDDTSSDELYNDEAVSYTHLTLPTKRIV